LDTLWFDEDLPTTPVISNGMGDILRADSFELPPDETVGDSRPMQVIRVQMQDGSVHFHIGDGTFGDTNQNAVTLRKGDVLEGVPDPERSAERLVKIGRYVHRAI
ncbi:hypothetical protein KC878_01405, partial [Candidatus Saccharibacteria bacterium]|nr:hypothetical protein [Candidatus Saccharibacteria bacterium]